MEQIFPLALIPPLQSPWSSVTQRPFYWLEINRLWALACALFNPITSTLQGTHSFEEQEPILPQIEAAVEQGIPISLDTIPAAATQPQLSIRTDMTEQQEEINTTTGQASQEAQRINVITNPTHGALKGNPPFIFDGDRSITRRFIVNFDLFKAIN